MILLIIGLFIGATLGILVAALLFAARQPSEIGDRLDIYNTDTWTE